MNLKKHALFPKAALLEMALGLDSDEKIALRFNLAPADLATIRLTPQYATEIARLAAEMRDSGFTFRRKNALLAEDIIEKLYLKAMDPDTGAATSLDIYRTFSKYGELEPKDGAILGGQAGAFSISIVVNGSQVTANAVKDITPETFELPDFTRDEVAAGFEVLTALNPPAFLNGADLSVNDEVTANAPDSVAA
jgi:hypothetical protein